MSSSGASATARLWERRDRRVPAVAAAAALTGVPTQLLREASRVSFAASVECEAILAAMPERIRMLPMSLEKQAQRCVHEVRGPVMWSETITARANAFGDEDVFVCSTVVKGYDTEENRLLVWLLSQASRAFRAVRGPLGEYMQAGDRRRVEEIAVTARKWRQSPRLLGVEAQRPNTRQLQRMRTGRHGELVEPLLTGRRRLLQPFTSADVEELTDAPTAAEHTGVLEVFEAVDGLSGSEMVLGFASGALRVGPAAYRHPNSPGSSPAGLSVDGRRLEDPEEAIRAVRSA